MSSSHKKFFLQSLKAIVIPAIVFVVFFIGFSSREKVIRAASSLFYPSSCLGGWEYPENATGEFSTVPDSGPQDFTKENSAYVKDRVAPIYCGGFKGEIPVDTQAKEFILSFSWSVEGRGVSEERDQESFEASSEIKTPEETLDDNSENQTKDSEPTDSSDENSKESEIKSEEVKPTETIEIKDEPVLENEPTAFKINWGRRVFAQEETKIEETDLTTSENIIIEPEIEGEVKGLFDAPAESLEKTETDKTETPAEAFLEVSYTLDGSDWITLGTVGRNNWQEVSFVVPLESWNDLSNFQVSLNTLSSFDETPTIYLDGVRLEVRYENSLGGVVPSDFHISEIKNETENLTMAIGGPLPAREQIVVSRKNGELGGLVIFDNISGAVIMNTFSEEKVFVVDPESFGVGEFTLITTNDINTCGFRSREACLEASDMTGYGTFKVVLKQDPFKAEEIVTEEPIATNESLPETAEIETTTEEHVDTEEGTETLPSIGEPVSETQIQEN